MLLQTELSSTRSLLAQVHQRFSYETEQAAKIQEKLTILGVEKTLLVKAVALIDRTIQVISANGIERIESTVTNGLRLVFPQRGDLAFKIIKKEGARGNSYALEVQKKGGIHGPIMETFGGSVVNVVSFLLRVIMIKRFRLAPFIAVDECFKDVATIYQPMVSQLLRTLTSEGGFTILAVTHQPILATAADRVYRVVDGLDEPPTLIRLTDSQMADPNFITDLITDINASAATDIG